MNNNLSKQELYNMASTMAGSDTPTERLITENHDADYLEELRLSFGLTITTSEKGKLVHS